MYLAPSTPSTQLLAGVHSAHLRVMPTFMTLSVVVFDEIQRWAR